MRLLKTAGKVQIGVLAPITSRLVGVFSPKFSRRRDEVWSTHKRVSVSARSVCKLTQFHLLRGSRVRFSGLFARWRCCERNFNYLNCPCSRTCGARRHHVGLCPALLILVCTSKRECSLDIFIHHRGGRNKQKKSMITITTIWKKEVT